MVEWSTKHHWWRQEENGGARREKPGRSSRNEVRNYSAPHVDLPQLQTAEDHAVTLLWRDGSFCNEIKGGGSHTTFPWNSMSKMLSKVIGYRPVVKGFMGMFCTFSHTIFENKLFMNTIKLLKWVNCLWLMAHGSYSLFCLIDAE